MKHIPGWLSQLCHMSATNTQRFTMCLYPRFSPRLSYQVPSPPPERQPPPPAWPRSGASSIVAVCMPPPSITPMPARPPPGPERARHSGAKHTCRSTALYTHSATPMCYMHYMRIHQHINARRKIRREITISTARYMNKPINTNQL